VTALDIEVRRALNAGSRGHWAHKRRNNGPVITWDHGITVYRATANQPYGRSTQSRSYLTHVTSTLYLAWRGGHHAGALIKWRCGGSTNHFRLLAEPDSPLCPICLAVAVRSLRGTP
jgi:hypothetical protein